jgi:membrane-bound inhibitor of C-type lysozyme
MSTVTLQRYRVTVALPRRAGDGALVPPAAQVLAEEAAAAVAAEDLMTAWTAATTLLSMTVGSQCQPDALSAGWAAAQALGGTDGATVHAEQVSARRGAVPGD